MRLALLLRSAWVAAASALLLWPSVGQAQSLADKLNRPDLKLVDLKPAELEIYNYPVYETRNGRQGSFQDGVIGPEDELTVVAAVRNNGDLRGAFDYALGPQKMNKAWWKASGTDLKGGDTDLAIFRVPYRQLAERLDDASKEICLGLWLLRQNLSVGWSDSDNPNHQRKVCFDFAGVKQ